MLRDQLAAPGPDALLRFLRRHLRAGDCLVQVAAECEVFYQGRAASMAEAGDYLLVMKCDGSLQIHGARGIKPVNWQPQVDDVQLELDDGRAVLLAERFSPPELVRVAFLDVALVQALELREATGFVLMGSEAQMQRALARDPGLIEEGLQLLELELPTEVGGIDLYARDPAGRLVVVELKRGKATQEAVHQLARYVEAVQPLVDVPVRGILAAPAITAPALAQLQRQGLEFREVTALPLDDEGRPRQGGLFG